MRGIGDALAILAGVVGGGASAYGGALDLRQEKQRQAARDQETSALAALQRAAAQQQMTQGADQHALGLLQAMAPGAVVRRGPPPTAPQYPEGSAVGALSAASQRAGAAALSPRPFSAASPLPSTPVGPAPGRFVEQGGFHADTEDTKETRERTRAEERNRATYSALKLQYPDLVGPYSAGVDYASLADNYMSTATARENARLASSDRRAAADASNGLSRAILAGKDGDQRIQRESGLRDDFRSEPVVKDAEGTKGAFVQIQSAYAATRNPATRGVGDLGLIIGTAKMADPTSVVRTEEGEAVRQTEGLPGEVWAAWNQVRGEGTLTEPMRQALVTYATNYARNKQAIVRPVQARYGALSRRLGADSAAVAYDPYEGMLPSGAPAGGATPGAKPDARTRAQQLKAAGKSRDEIAATMRSEGYNVH